jgi:hypothetical protein
MQPTHLSDNLMPRPQIEVIGVVQHETEAKLLEVDRINPLYRPQRPNRHEGRRVDGTMGSAESSHPRARHTIHLLH